MWERMYNKDFQKKVWLVLLFTVMPAFLFWGIGSYVSSRKETKPVGALFGKPVSPDELQQSLAAIRLQMMMQFGDNFTQLEKMLDFNGLALERIMLLREAANRKIRANDDDVRNTILSNPIFQRKGVFDQGTYDQVLRFAFKMPKRAYEEQIRQNLVLKKLFDEITRAVAITDADVRAEYEKENQQMSIAYLVAQPSDFIAGLTFTDEELKEYYAGNSVEFKQPESYAMEYIKLDNEAHAVGASSLIEQKKSLEDIAAGLNAQIQQTGWFSQNDPVPGIGWVQDIAMTLPTLQPGQILPPVQVDKSYFVLRLKEHKEASIPGFESIRELVKETLTEKKSKELAKARIEEAVKTIKESAAVNPAGINLTAIAQAAGLKTNVTDPFKFGSYIQGIGASDAFFTAASQLKDNEFSDPIEMPTGFYIVKRQSIVPVDEKKFLEEKTAFGEKILSRKKEAVFADFVKEIKTKALGG